MIKFAIVGCGHISTKHIDAINQIHDAKLVAFCDTNQERLNDLFLKYGVSGYTGMDEMFNNEEIDVVNICTPSGFHADLAVKSAEYGKHIIVEKPISLTIHDAERIISASKHNKVKLSIVHPNRFKPVVQELKKAMDNNLFGKLSHANATVRWNRNQEYYAKDPWRGTKDLDGGVLMNQAIHNIDLMLWMMGEVEEVSSMNATRIRDIEAEDVSVGIIKFKNGSLGIVEAAVTIYPKNLEETLCIFGEKGTVKIGGTTLSKIEHWDFFEQDSDQQKKIVDKVNADPIGKSGHSLIIQDMVDSIQNDKTPIISGIDGKQALAVIVALYKAAEENRVVKISEITNN